MDGSVMSQLGSMTERQRLACIRMVADGLAFIHQKGYIHRDLAGRNLLYSKATEIVKIADYGLSENSPSVKLTDTTKITVRWTAPEVMISLNCSQASDVWSFGIVICELTTKDEQKPFRGISDADVRVVLKENKVGCLPRLGGTWPQPLVDVYKACLQFDPSKRPTMDKVLQQLPIKGSLSTPVPSSTPTDQKHKTPDNTPEKTADNKTPKATPPDPMQRHGRQTASGRPTRSNK